MGILTPSTLIPSNHGVLAPSTLGGVDSIPRQNLLFYARNGVVDSVGESTKLLDLTASGKSEALPGQSLKFSGAQYVELDSAVTLTGDFTIKIGAYDLNDYTNAVFGEATSQENYLYIDPTSGNPKIGLKINNVFNSVNLSSAGNGIYKIIRVGSIVSVYFNDSLVGSKSSYSTDDFTFNVLGMSQGGFDVDGNLWDIYAEDETGVKLDMPLADGSGSTALSRVGPHGTLNGFTLPDDWTESALFGSTVHNELGYSQNVTDGVELWDSTPDSIGAGWTQSGDEFTCDGTNASQVTDTLSTDLIVDETVLYSYTIVARNSGLVRAYLGGFYTDTINIDIGSYSDLLTVPSTGSLLGVRSASFDGTVKIDSVQRYYSSRVPADPSNPGYDIFGNSLTNPGPLAHNVAVKGYTGDWDGVAYATLASSVVLGGDFRLDLLANPSIVGDNAILFDSLGANYIINNRASMRLVAYIASSYAEVQLSHNDGIDKMYRVGNVLYVEYKGVVIGQGVVSTGDLRFNRFAGSATKAYEGILSYLKIYDSTDTLIHHWVVESSQVSDQTIIYDVVGGNHATLQGATLPFFTQEVDKSYLAANGGKVVENLLKYSEDLSNAVWSAVGSATIIDSVLTVSAQFGTLQYDDLPQVAGTTYKVGIKCRAISGTNAYTFYDNSNNNSLGTFTPTETLQWFYVTFIAPSTRNIDLRFQDRNDSGFGAIEIVQTQVTKDDGSYIQTTDTAIPYSIVPAGATSDPLTFRGPLDAPANVFLLNAPGTPEIVSADDTNIFIDASGNVLDVDPYDLPLNTSNKIYKGDKALVLYTEALTGITIDKAEQYAGDNPL